MWGLFRIKNHINYVYGEDCRCSWWMNAMEKVRFLALPPPPPSPYHASALWSFDSPSRSWRLPWTTSRVSIRPQSINKLLNLMLIISTKNLFLSRIIFINLSKKSLFLQPAIITTSQLCLMRNVEILIFVEYSRWLRGETKLGDVLIWACLCRLVLIELA